MIRMIFALLLIGVFFWWALKLWRALRAKPLCPRCRRWHDNSCLVAGRPHVTRCRVYQPGLEVVAIEEILDETDPIKSGGTEES